jgi:purine-binding chemotaxis protein CheW
VSRQLLCFDLGTETYAVDLLRVRQIAAFEDVVRVPSTPSFVRGLLALQEGPVPVIDLANKFGFAEVAVAQHTSVVVADACIDGGPAVMGFLVGAQSRVVEIEESAVEAVPELGAGLRVEFLCGLARVDGHPVFIVDLDRTLSATEAEALQGLAAEHLAQIEAAVAAGCATEASPRVPDERAGSRADEAGEEYVVFAVSGEKLALGLNQARELLQYGTVTPVPGAREWIRGVTNRRGRVTAIVDLAKCLGLPPAPITARSCILVLDLEVEGNRTAVGIAIDDVLDVVALAPQQIEVAPRLGVAIPPDRLRGVARVGDGFVSLLAVEHLLPLASPTATNASPGQTRLAP